MSKQSENLVLFLAGDVIIPSSAESTALSSLSKLSSKLDVEAFDGLFLGEFVFESWDEKKLSIDGWSRSCNNRTELNMNLNMKCKKI